MNRAKEANRLFLVLVLLHVGLSFLLAFLPFDLSLPFYGNILLSEAILVVPAAVMWRFGGGRRESVTGSRRFSPTLALLTMLVVGLFMPLFTFLNALSMLFVENQMASSIGDVADQPFLINLLFIAFLPAACEEFVFRGALYGTYRKFGVGKAMILCAFLFGCLHMNFNQFVYTAAAGLLFAFIMEGTGSIAYSVFAHFLMNGGSVFLMAVLKWTGQTDALNASQSVDMRTAYGNYTWFVYAVYGIVALAMAILGATAFWLLVKYAGREGHMRAILRREYTYEKERFVTPSLIVGALVCIAYMAFVEFY